MRQEILKRVGELAEFASKNGENPAAIVLFALSGAMKSLDDELLAKVVQDYLNNVLIPKLKASGDNHLKNLN